MTSRELFVLLDHVTKLAQDNPNDVGVNFSLVVLYTLQGSLVDGNVDELAELAADFAQRKRAVIALLASL